MAREPRDYYDVRDQDLVEQLREVKHDLRDAEARFTKAKGDLLSHPLKPRDTTTSLPDGEERISRWNQVKGEILRQKAQAMADMDVLIEEKNTLMARLGGEHVKFSKFSPAKLIEVALEVEANLTEDPQMAHRRLAVLIKRLQGAAEKAEDLA